MTSTSICLRLLQQWQPDLANPRPHATTQVALTHWFLDPFVLHLNVLSFYPPQKKKCQKMSKLILGSRYQQLHPASKGPKGPCPFVSLAFSIGFHRLAHDLTRSDHDAVAVEQASLPVYGTRFVSSWKFISSTVSQRICCPPPSSRSWSSTLAPLKASVPRCLFCRPHSHSPGM